MKGSCNNRKQPEPIISTVRGMTIDVREEKENVSDSILRNNESDSIEIDERDLQEWKQEEPIISIVRRIANDILTSKISI
jgi:hypothetical protein